MQPNLAPSVQANVPAFIAPSVPLPPETTPAADAAAPLVLLGLDKSGKAHGARLVGAEAAAVEQAADLMDFFFFQAHTEALRELAATLPLGRLFPSGRAYTPFIKVALYDRLLAAAGVTAPPRPIKAAAKAAEAGGSTGGAHGHGAGGSGAGDPPATRAGVKAPATFSDIGTGSCLLAEDEAEGGYYLAEVVATKADNHFVLRWVDYPELPEFSRARRALALLHPEVVEVAE